MDRFADGVIRHRKGIIVLFAVAAAVCALLFLTVEVNYNMADYLPPEAQSTVGLNMMNREFTGAMPNGLVTVAGVSLQEALAFKGRLAEASHVAEVIWLDDVADLKVPLEMGDAGLIEGYYKDGNARFSVVIEKGFEKQGVTEIRRLLDGRGTVTGEAADIEFAQSATGTEVMHAIMIILPFIIVILLLSTASWVEPLLFLAAIGVSVVINMGTNAVFGRVSFLTNSVTPILQLAVSLDYAIFLLHSFGAHRKRGIGVGEAMHAAVKESFSAVAASASTTLFGFMALIFMDFRIGADLGMSLAKGIVFSFISVMVFLPALTMCVYKVIDRTRHREWMPAFANIHGILRRVAVPAVVLVAVMIVPCFLGQSRTDFLYGYGTVETGAKTDRALEEQAAAGENSEAMGGKASLGEIAALGTASVASWEETTDIVLLVPRGDMAREELLCDDLAALPAVTAVMSYVETVGAGIPPEFLEAPVREQFYSENLARVIVTVDTPKEGEAAFAAVESVTAAAEKYYPGEVHAIGQSANLYDIKTVVQNDNRLTSLLAVLSIFMVLLLTFRSAVLPFLLMLTIMSAIWINLSIPYFTGTSINYIGYLVLNTVQLGATIDYAILLTVTYLRKRRVLPRREAVHEALGSSFRSILVSAVTLATAGFTLALTSSNPIIYDIGMLLGRGTLLSMILVVVFLPALLTLFDGAVGRLTYKAGFLAERGEKSDG